ncbi:MAG: FecR domain-containing protein, partial [Desulfobulbaceae bacterium]|nr:FecR domain-containing protein [Desulfobulbaceae bacterium]
MNKALPLLTFFTLFLLFNLPAVAGDLDKPVGSVVAVRGEVFAVSTANKSRKLALKAPVFQQDTLKTGKNGRLQILFEDNTIISLGRATEMKVAAYEWRPEQKTGTINTKVSEGIFRVMG